MIKRPKNTDSEKELLEMQMEYMKEKERNANFQPAAKVVRKMPGEKSFSISIYPSCYKRQCLLLRLHRRPEILSTMQHMIIIKSPTINCVTTKNSTAITLRKPFHVIFYFRKEAVGVCKAEGTEKQHE